MCRNIVDTQYGRVFKYPNAVWGLAYYPLLIVLAALNHHGVITVSWLLPLVVTLILVFSFYLGWGLYRLKVTCRSCIGTHLINISIFILIVFGAC